MLGIPGMCHRSVSAGTPARAAEISRYSSGVLQVLKGCHGELGCLPGREPSAFTCASPARGEARGQPLGSPLCRLLRIEANTMVKEKMTIERREKEKR